MKLFELSNRREVGYHGTPTSKVASIKRNGLKSGDSTVVYLASTKEGALTWARALHPDKEISVLTVKHDKKTSGPVIQIHGDVAPEDIIAVENFAESK